MLDMGTMATSDLHEIDRLHTILADLYIANLRELHPRAYLEMLPHAGYWLPDFELAESYGEETFNDVCGAAEAVFMVSCARIELENRARPN